MSGPILPLNGLTVSFMALPTVVGTFFKHITTSQDSDPANRNELKADEALAVARSMSQKITQYPVEDVQVRLYRHTLWAHLHVAIIDVICPLPMIIASWKFLPTGPLERQSHPRLNPCLNMFLCR
jgi:hypothetical protein